MGSNEGDNEKPPEDGKTAESGETAATPAPVEDSGDTVSDLSLPPAIKKELDEVVEALPTQQQQRQLVSVIRSVSKLHTGPLPDPETLAAYQNLIPDGANRLMAIHESQMAHRQTVELMVANAQVDMMKSSAANTARGQWMAYSIVFVFLAASVLFAFNGMLWLAGTLVSTTLVSLVTVFIVGKHFQRRDAKPPKKD
jgi:uncharacterized membrane protein